MKIENYNCNGLCCEKFCNNKFTHAIEYKLFDMDFIIPLCEEHENKIVDFILDKKKKVKYDRST